jgi:hypothetical protein
MQVLRVPLAALARRAVVVAVVAAPSGSKAVAAAREAPAELRDRVAAAAVVAVRQ